MLTRLQVNGFKNLEEVDLRFGPFTCIAGPNGVGKSNLFDAIRFLAALADKPLMEAAASVRGAEARQGDVRSLFRRVGKQVSPEMNFAAEMLIPLNGEDALGQPANASMTFLRYELTLRARVDSNARLNATTLEIVHENMVHLNRSEAQQHLRFDPSKAWRESVVRGRRTSPYISTHGLNVLLHTDIEGGQGGGRPRQFVASSLPRTVLSSANSAAEYRTLVLARQEMMSWVQLQLEPSALRAPDPFTAPKTLSPNGAHLPATLYALAQASERQEPGTAQDVYASIASRLGRFVENVREITVLEDEKRELLSIAVTDQHKTEHIASALSDGTLRFLALTIMEADPHSRRLICLEEPENGVHPLKIGSMLELLQELAVDINTAVDEDNPLRQVIINTHSPSVVALVQDSDLITAERDTSSRAGVQETRLRFKHLPGTWRPEDDREQLSTKPALLAYLSPLAIEANPTPESPSQRGTPPSRPSTLSKRVIHRNDLQAFLPGLDAQEPST
jgi:predicted ATPase